MSTEILSPSSRSRTSMYFIGFVVTGSIIVWTAVLLRARPSIPRNALMWGSLGVVIAGTVIGYDFYHRDLGPIPVTFDRIMLFGLFFLWAYGWLFIRQTEVRLDWLDLAVAVWFGVILCSTFFTDWQYKNKLPLSRFLFFNAIPVAVYVVLKHGRFAARNFEAATWGFGLLGVYLGLTAVAEWQQWYGLVYPRIISSSDFPEFLGRGRGPLLNPVINGMIMTTCASVLLVRLPMLNWKMRAVVGVGILFISAGIVCTMTRSVWLGYLVSVLVLGLAPLAWRMRVRILVTCAVAGIVAYSAVGPALESFKRDQYVTKAEMAESLKLRPLLAIVAYEMFWDHPISGVGFGQYGKYKKPYHQIDGYDLPLRTALDYMQHNVVLSYLTETGMIGVLVLLFLWGAIAVAAARVWSCRQLTTADRTWGLVTLAYFITYAINGMFHDVSIIPMANTYLLFFAGLSGSLADEIAPSRSRSSVNAASPKVHGEFGSAVAGA